MRTAPPRAPHASGGAARCCVFSLWLCVNDGGVAYLCRTCGVLVAASAESTTGSLGTKHDSPYSVGLGGPCVGGRSECHPDRSSLGSLLTGDRGFRIQRYLRALVGQPSRV